MGQEISGLHFKHEDFQRYQTSMQREMALLQDWFREGVFSTRSGVIGAELEAWLVDPEGLPTPWNARVISKTDRVEVVPELARYNVEFNTPPCAARELGIDELYQNLQSLWLHCDRCAESLGTSLIAIGLLPTLEDSMLTLRHLSPLHRYRALNEQVLRLRHGRPIQLRVSGKESLTSEHRDVMLEAATTSFQVHIQVPWHDSVRYYNASLIASAATIAVACNAPFLFGKSLWDESRIPLFEQAVALGDAFPARVTFGTGYARASLYEIFEENRQLHPVLLPLGLDTSIEKMAHVRLLNGTIWRWNRPLIGFDADGAPHLRIEHRVMPAGPSLVDMVANLAFYLGLVESLVREDTPPELRLPFEAARDNFYRCARTGLASDVVWLQGNSVPIPALLLQELLPRAEAGLEHLNVDASARSRWLGIVRDRVASLRTGAQWQRDFIQREGKDFSKLVRSYQTLQRTGSPVHTWSLAPVQSIARRRSMLRVESRIPEPFLQVTGEALHGLLKQPTLFHLEGRRPSTLFVSIVLHGNEDVGLRAIQRVLRKYAGRELPRSLSVFVGNVEAAEARVRHLPHQPDFNRVWPGSDREESPEHALMRHVMDEMKARPLFASIDLHNNTGWNPTYSCVCDRSHATLHLASLFGRTAVYFERPLGVQTKAFSELVPSVTCECGKVGDEMGVAKAAEFIDACLHLSEIPTHAVPDEDLHLFQTVATILVPERIRMEFGEPSGLGRELTNDDAAHVDLWLRPDLDRLNFQELNSCDALGWSPSPSTLPLVVVDDQGKTCTERFLRLQHHRIELMRPVIPAMLTCNPAVVRQDCLGYFMERLPLPK